MSKETIRTFLIMSHGSWPEKQIKTDAAGRQFDTNGNLHIGLKGYNSTTHTMGGSYKDIEDTVYKIPKKTRLFTTTDYGNLAVVCPKYDILIKKYIGEHGTNIFTLPSLRESLSEYEFIKNSRLYTDGINTVDIDIKFEKNEESWNIWEKGKYGLTVVPNLNLTQKYRLSDIINYLTVVTQENYGIAVPNQRTRIILHCCMPYISNFSWNEYEYAELRSKINLMMARGMLNIKMELQRNRFLEKKFKKNATKKRDLRSGVISRNNQVRSNTKRKERLLRKGVISYYTNKKNNLSYKSQRKKASKFKIGRRKTNYRMKK